MIRPSALLNLALACIATFAGIYSLCFLHDSGAFRIISGSLNWQGVPSPALALFVFFFYFSSTTFCTVGFGDVVAALWWTRALVMLQMLLSQIFSIAVFAISLNHFRAARPRPKPRHALSRCFAWLLRFPCIARSRMWLLRHLLPVNVVLQAAMMGLSSGLGEDSQGSGRALLLSALLLLQTLVLLFMLLVSWRAVRQLNSNNVSLRYLLHTYLSLIITFAGVYATLQLLSDKQYFNVPVSDQQSLPASYYIFLYFSLTITSTTGFELSI